MPMPTNLLVLSGMNQASQNVQKAPEKRIPHRAQTGGEAATCMSMIPIKTPTKTSKARVPTIFFRVAVFSKPTLRRGIRTVAKSNVPRRTEPEVLIGIPTSLANRNIQQGGKAAVIATARKSLKMPSRPIRFGWGTGVVEPEEAAS